MNAADKIYTTLCVVFAVFIVVGNLIYQKFVFLPILPFHTFELSVGAITYPLTFMLTDLIAEFYGKNKANFCVRSRVEEDPKMLIWILELLWSTNLHVNEVVSFKAA